MALKQGSPNNHKKNRSITGSRVSLLCQTRGGQTKVWSRKLISLAANSFRQLSRSARYYVCLKAKVP